MPFKRFLGPALCLALALSHACLRAADDEADQSNLGYSGVPIVGYDDKSGWLWGGAGFIYSDGEPGINAGLFGVTNLNDFHSVTLNYEQRQGKWLFGLHGLTERAFDNYYGEGDLTGTDNTYRISMYHFEFKPTVLYKVYNHLRVGLFDDYRSRVETGLEPLRDPRPTDPSRLFPDESTNAVGLRVDWDTRDKLINTRMGDYFQLNLSHGPGEWTTWPDHGGFTQLQLDLRRFSTVRYHLVWARRILAGMTTGDPSYLFRYRLGGTDILRGYKDNRFRGDDYFLLQNELRWFLRKWLSVNASVDMGDIGDSRFEQLKCTAQIGLRIGLPPDWGQKLRVDLGYGQDQQTFQIQFSEVF